MRAKALPSVLVFFAHCAYITASSNGVLVTATFGSEKLSTSRGLSALFIEMKLLSKFSLYAGYLSQWTAVWWHPGLSHHDPDLPWDRPLHYCAH